MVKVEVRINGKTYNLIGRENEEYLLELGTYVDDKVKEVRAKNNRLNNEEASALAALNIADELYRLDKDYKILCKEKKEADNSEYKKKYEEILSYSEEAEKISKNEIKELQDELAKIKGNMETIKQENDILKDKNLELKKKITSHLTSKKGDNQELKTVKYKNLDLENKLMEANVELTKLKSHKNPLIK